MGLIPGRGTKIPQATWWSQKTNKRFSEVGNYPVIAIVTEVQRWVCTCSSFPLGWCYILEVFSNHPGYSHLVPRGFGMGRGEVFIIKEYIYTDCDILAYLSLRGYSAKKKKKSSEAGEIRWLQWNVSWIWFNQMWWGQQIRRQLPWRKKLLLPAP